LNLGRRFNAGLSSNRRSATKTEVTHHAKSEIAHHAKSEFAHRAI
jgi:hypothetical protein